MSMSLLALLALLSAAVPTPPPGQLVVTVDASEAPRRIFHTWVAIPAKAGPLTLLYPKWIPGEHAPVGPIDKMAGLRFTAGGKPVPWRRDAEDMYAFHLEVPAGATQVQATFDHLSTPGGNFSASGSGSAQLAVISWNQLVLYPKGARADTLAVKASLVLPGGWKHASALPAERGRPGHFTAVSLETLIDSPVLIGQNLRTVELGGPHRLHVAADSAAALGFGDDIVDRYRRLVTEAEALFGARHYHHYDFLLSLSDQVTHFGLEHHQSSDNRQRERVFLDDALRVTGAGLLPHEYVHSWNGKFRRPAGLVTPDFHTPMKGDLLWIYEGLTTYLGEVLTARSGLRTPEQEREAIALTAAGLDVAPGRTWRPLADTAVAAPLLYGRPTEWRSWRRGVDFYQESELIWLEVDALVRQKSDGQKSLDDFCKVFHGKTSGPAAVEPYTLDDVVAALNGVVAHDWRGFFSSRIEVTTARAPLGGLEAAGWRLVYREAPSAYLKQVEQAGKSINLSWSLGLSLKEDGTVLDAIPGLPAARAGVAPGMKVIAVGGRRFSGDVVRDAVKGTKQRADVELLMENGEYFRTYKVAYRGGARYPALERIAGKADVLGEIFRGRVGSR